MRRSVLLFLLCGLLPGQDAGYRSAVLVLKDGRVIATRGEYEVMGEEVQFTFDNGELMTMPLAKIDLTETDRRNREMKQRQNLVAPDEDDIYSQVEAYKQGWREEPISDPPAVTQTDPPAVTPTDPQTEDWSTLFEDIGQFLDQVRKEDHGPAVLFTFFGLVLLFLLLFLVSLCTQIYLVFKSFGIGAGWGLTLSLFLVGKLFLFPLLLFGEIEAWMEVVALFSEFLLSLATLVFILFHCHGSRMKLLLLLYSPTITLLLLCLLALAMSLI